MAIAVVANEEISMNKPDTKPVQIGELAKNLGVTTRTIRYYEEIGMMGKTERLGGGTRTYNKEDILRLKFILKLKTMGISLKEIQELSDIFDIHEKDFTMITPKLIEILDNHIARVDEKMANLSSLRKDIVEYRIRMTEFLTHHDRA
jgi:MerR family transcriptional regulator, repressor of the yfmOP operon